MAQIPFPKPSIGTIVAAVSGNASPFGPKSGLKIQIDPNQLFYTGTLTYAKYIDRLGMAFSSFKEPLRETLNTVVVPSVYKNFASQGRPAWKALKKSTIQDRLRRGFPRGPILQRTGRLRRGATRKNIWEIRPMTGSKGSDILRLRVNYFKQLVPYGEFHQMGARSGVRKFGFVSYTIAFEQGFESKVSADQEKFELFLPARPFIQLTGPEEVEIYSIFVAFMVKQVNKYWGSGSAGR